MVSRVDQPRRYQRVVDGLVLPVAVASHPALDFCNTLAGWNSDKPCDYLASYEHLAVWTREANLLDASTAKRLRHGAELDPRSASRQLRRARSLRHALYAACIAEDGTAWEVVAQQARAAAANAVLVQDEAPGRRWSISDSVGLARPVLELARCAGNLLAEIDLAGVRACPGTGCGWLFLDPSGRRRWCTMAVCGNRAKVRRHAERARRARPHERVGG